MKKLNFTMRETKEDLKHEGMLANTMAEILYAKASKAHAKYRIDGWFHQNKNLIGWFECKWYSQGHKAFAMLNVPKFKELVDLAELTGKPSYFLMREKQGPDVPGRMGYILIHDGKKIQCQYECKIAGGTPPGRKPLPDDVEPLIIFSYSEIVWAA